MVFDTSKAKNYFLNRSLRFLPCAVCFQPTDHQMTDALNKSIIFLFILTGIVLIGLTSLVLFIVKADRTHKSI